MSDEPNKPSETPATPPCRVCGRVALWHFCDVVPGGGMPETVHLCEEHGREYNQAMQQTPDSAD
jgi:hypothetical protein